MDFNCEKTTDESILDEPVIPFFCMFEEYLRLRLTFEQFMRQPCYKNIHELELHKRE
jgi:hypothetical protein